MRHSLMVVVLLALPAIAGDGADSHFKFESPDEEIRVPRAYRFSCLVDGDDKWPEIGDLVDVTSIAGEKDRQPGVIGELRGAQRASFLAFDSTNKTAKLRVKAQEARWLRDAMMHGREFIIRPAV